MPRRISSLSTFYVKFVSPFFFVLWTIFFIRMLVGAGGGGLGEVAFAMVFVAVTLGIALWMSWGLKRVSIDDLNLYVSNYRKEITIPLTEISDVREFLFSEPRRVTIDLSHTSEFGDKIVFLATYRMFAFLSPHPIVDELIQMTVRRTMTD